MTEPHMPGSSEAEEQVLACVLSSPRAIMRVIDLLKPAHFATPDYANIYECMTDLARERKAPTTFNVADELVRRQMRSLDIKQMRWELEQIAFSFALDTRLEDYAESIIRASRYRRLLVAFKNGAEAAYKQEEGCIEKVLETIMAIAQDGDLRGMSTFAEASDRYMAELDERIGDAREGRPIGVRTGFRAIDRMIGNLRPSDLDILAAITSVGKTSWALMVALNVAKQAMKDGKHVGFFSLEMRESELVQRLISMDSFIDSSLLRDGMISDADHEEVRGRVRDLRPMGLHISDTAYRLDTIKSQARALCARYPIGLLIVDYLQLVDVEPGGNKRQMEHEKIAEISRSLKRMAQDLNVAVLALAQINREGEKESEPQVRHLAGSGGPGRDADMVAFLHVQPEEMEKRNRAEDYYVDFLVRKQRNGRLGQERLMFRPRLTRFDEIMMSSIGGDEDYAS